MQLPVGADEPSEVTELGDPINRESLRRLLDHWIEHNDSHSRSFRERAAQVAEISGAAAQDIREAADLMDRCTQMLRKAAQDL